MHRRLLVATATCVFALLSLTASAAERIIGGTPADTAEWPASVHVTFGNSRCSGTLVGPRTLLLAAHCTGPGVPATFSIGATAYTANCQRHPAYPQQDIDVALCQVDREVKDVPFERLLVESGRLALGQTLRLTGYGCARVDGVIAQDGIFRIGDAPIVELPRSTSVDIQTEGTAALCFGDSGGAAYFVEENGNRLAVAVNSKGDIQKRSYLAATFDPRVVEFLQAWAKATGEKICGLHEEAASCRPNGPPTAFYVETEVGTARVRVKPKYAEKLESIRSAVEAAMAP